MTGKVLMLPDKLAQTELRVDNLAALGAKIKESQPAACP